VVAGALLASGQGLAGALVTHAASVLDGVDGELARLQLRASPWGALLDGFLDRLADVAIVAGLGLWSLTQGLNPSITLGLAVAASAGSLLSMATKDRIAALKLPGAPERRLASCWAAATGACCWSPCWPCWLSPPGAGGGHDGVAGQRRAARRPRPAPPCKIRLLADYLKNGTWSASSAQLLFPGRVAARQGRPGGARPALRDSDNA
jgi:hypothetical protein